MSMSFMGSHIPPMDTGSKVSVRSRPDSRSARTAYPMRSTGPAKEQAAAGTGPRTVTETRMTHESPVQVFRFPPLTTRSRRGSGDISPRFLLGRDRHPERLSYLRYEYGGLCLLR